MHDERTIPFVDMVGLHQGLESELTSVFQQALRTAGFIGGPMVEGFERDFAGFCDAAYCVGVASGTDALRFALMAAGVKPGDVVISVPHTFIATTEAISQAGAHPEFVDVDERTHGMDAGKLLEYLQRQCEIDPKSGRAIHKRLKAPVTAVVPVHIYGQIVDMDPILELAAKYHFMVVEDACQAHGAEYFSQKEQRWRKAGSIGVAAAFSFYPGKNLGAFGEAGAVTTNSEEIAGHVRMIRDHGQSQKYHHAIEGYNGRLDAIQAGILHVKLAHLAKWNQQRREAASRYSELLERAATSLALPFEPSWSRSIYHLYVVRSTERDKLQQHLLHSGIHTGIHYPIPVHLQEAYRSLGFKVGDFPVAEAVAKQVLSLPMFPSLTAAQQEKVVEAVVQFEGDRRELFAMQLAERA